MKKQYQEENSDKCSNARIEQGDENSIKAISSTTTSLNTVVEGMQTKTTGCAIVGLYNFHNLPKLIHCGRKGGNI